MSTAIINARDFGAGYGAPDDTQALNNALAAVPIQGATVILPDSNYTVRGPLTISRHGTRIVGAGDKATQIVFAPSSDAVCFDFVKTGQVLANCAIRNLRIVGSGAAKKVGIRAVDTTRIHIDQIVMSAMTGDTSIGIQLQGREFTYIGWVEIYADRPISIEKNPNECIDCDMAHFQDIALVALEPAESCFYIAPNINVTNLAMSGEISMAKGTHGIYWNDTETTGGTSWSLCFSGIRREQSEDDSGYTVFINHYIHGVSLQDVKGDNAAKGFYFRKVRGITLLDCKYDGTPQTTTDPEGLNVDETCDSITILNCFWQLGSTRSIGELESVSSTRVNALREFPTNEVLDIAVT